MEIKNLKVNKKVSKLAKYALIGTLMGASLTGCYDGTKNKEVYTSEENPFKNLLDGTILENCIVCTFSDGSKDILRKYELCDFNFDIYNKGYHYFSIVSGTFFSESKCHHTCNSQCVNYVEIQNTESIIQYLTSSELIKAYNNELNDEDLSYIISRVITSQKENVISK